MEESDKNSRRRTPVEVYFLRYAFPCTYVKLARGEISESDYNELEKSAIEGFILSRPRLENIYKTAFFQIRNLAREMQKDIWDYEVIEEYFMRRHNEIINKGEGLYSIAPEKQKDLSRVKFGIVSEKKNDVLTVSFEDNTKRKVLNHLVPKAQAGDKVSVHYAHAVEIFSKH
ncbi:MAG: hypothetical protein Q8O89_04210 [Nanoarchaeota archaeon]|nr:hypothetical protein [Nanoarchaeota archaeon]